MFSVHPYVLRIRGESGPGGIRLLKWGLPVSPDVKKHSCDLIGARDKLSVKSVTSRLGHYYLYV